VAWGGAQQTLYQGLSACAVISLSGGAKQCGAHDFIPVAR
jgi:hypothetical protein